MSACQDASAIVVMTEWDAFKTYDYGALSALMAGGPRTFYDLRNIMARDTLVELPFDNAFQLGVGWLK